MEKRLWASPGRARRCRFPVVRTRLVRNSAEPSGSTGSSGTAGPRHFLVRTLCPPPEVIALSRHRVGLATPQPRAEGGGNAVAVHLRLQRHREWSEAHRGRARGGALLAPVIERAPFAPA
eukprot:gene18235-biopygen864